MNFFFKTIALIVIAVSILYAGESNEIVAQQRTVTTIGILQGGGSLIGADFEFLLNDHIGVQVGAGIVGFGAGLNFHFKPSIRSNFISLQYWNQGIGETFTQSVVGGTYVWRGQSWFTAQLGLGVRVATGEILKGTQYEDTNVMILYSLGAYF